MLATLGRALKGKHSSCSEGGGWFMREGRVAAEYSRDTGMTYVGARGGGEWENEVGLDWRVWFGLPMFSGVKDKLATRG